MGLPVLVYGNSGTGKSTSYRAFNEKELGIINVLGKQLPFKNNFKTFTSSDYPTIKQALLKSTVNTMVIDDAGYLLTSQFMAGHAGGKGNAIFDLYNQIGDNFWDLIRFVQLQLPAEKIVYIFMHEDKNDMGDIKPKTIGRMLDEKVCVEGLFTIVLRSFKEEGKYYFRTQSSGFDVSKSPIDMFNNEKIDNDLKQVDNVIREYYNLGGSN